MFCVCVGVCGEGVGVGVGVCLFVCSQFGFNCRSDHSIALFACFKGILSRHTPTFHIGGLSQKCQKLTFFIYLNLLRFW